MRASARGLIAMATSCAVLASVGYTAFALARTLAFGRRPVHEPDDDHAAAPLPRLTLLKPLRGVESHLAENLASFCEQDADDFEVIFGARDAADAALVPARELAARFPDRVRVVNAGETTPRHANPKIDTLAAMVPHATGGVLVISDSDMRVDGAYVRTIAAPFRDPNVGAVTCLYRGEPAGGDVASALGALGNHEHFAPSALVAHALMGQRFCFGATMAVRRHVFDAFGGLDALGAHLADDARLGELVAAQGKPIVLSRYVVENVVAEASLRELWQHELRWARTHRTLVPAGYAGLFLTYPISLALLHLPFARRRGRALVLLAAAIASRFALAAVARRAFGVRSRARPWLIPVRDVLGFSVWVASFAARDVRWRDDAYNVARDGRLTARTP